MKITIGEIFLRSGTVIPFAAEKLEWKEGVNGLTKVEHCFVHYRDHYTNIPKINFINWPDVVGIVTTKTKNVPEKELG